MTSEELLEIVAKAIALADERNGAAPYEARVREKHAKAHLFDQAEAVLEVLQAIAEEAGK